MTSDNCAKCRRRIGENDVMVQCISCQVRKHAECAKLSFREANKKRWRCRNCKFDSCYDGSPLKTTSTQELKEERNYKTKTKITKKENEKARRRKESPDLDKLKVQCYEGHFKLKSVERRLKSLKDSYEDVLDRNQRLEKELDTYKLKIEDLDQQIRKNCVEVWGIHVSKNDDLMYIINRLCDVMDCRIPKRQIDRVWKIKKPENEFLVGRTIGRMDTSVPNTIIGVNFVTNYDKEEFMSAWRSIEQAGGLTLKQMGINKEGSVKIENSLTPYKQQIFKKAMDYANEYNYQRVGVNDGEIYMLKDLKSGPMVLIKTPSDFEKLADIDRRPKRPSIQSRY